MAKDTYWKHVKTGGIYRIAGVFIEEATLTPVIAYEAVAQHPAALPPKAHQTPPGASFTRPVTEFLDGRFRQLPDYLLDQADAAAELDLVRASNEVWKARESLLTSDIMMRAFTTFMMRDVSDEQKKQDRLAVEKILQHLGVETVSRIPDEQFELAMTLLGNAYIGRTSGIFALKPAEPTPQNDDLDDLLREDGL